MLQVVGSSPIQHTDVLRLSIDRTLSTKDGSGTCEAQGASSTATLTMAAGILAGNTTVLTCYVH